MVDATIPGTGRSRSSCAASSSRRRRRCWTNRPISWPCRCTTASWAFCRAVLPMIGRLGYGELRLQPRQPRAAALRRRRLRPGARGRGDGADGPSSRRRQDRRGRGRAVPATVLSAAPGSPEETDANYRVQQCARRSCASLVQQAARLDSTVERHPSCLASFLLAVLHQFHGRPAPGVLEARRHFALASYRPRRYRPARLSADLNPKQGTEPCRDAWVPLASPPCCWRRWAVRWTPFS